MLALPLRVYICLFYLATCLLGRNMKLICELTALLCSDWIYSASLIIWEHNVDELPEKKKQ